MADEQPQTGSRDGRRRGFSIAAVLATTLAGLVFLAVASVVAINFTIGRENTIELLRDRGELVVSAIENEVRAQLDPAAAQLTYLANVLGDAERPPLDAARRADLLTGALAATPQITRVVFVTPDRRLTIVDRVGERPRVETVDQQSSSPLLRESLEIAAGRADGWWGDLILDPRGARGALVNRRHSVWRGTEFVGELAALVSVRELSGSLPNVTSGPAIGKSFILYDRNFVLAHTRLLQPVSGLTAEAPLPAIDQVDDPALAAIWQERQSVPLLGRGSNFHIVDVDGVRHLYLYRILYSYGPKPLVVGAWFPAEDAFGELRRLFYATGAGLAILLLGCIAAVLLGRQIARPITSLAAAASQLRTLEFTRMAPLRESRLRELADQARAFNDMLIGLRWLEAYVPRTLVGHLIRQGRGRKLPSVEREMTVLFTDIVGFTSLAEHRKAADTAALLNHHFGMITNAIEAEGGTVDKFIGDGAMAFWNAPVRHHDHAQRAARAALAIAAAIAADNMERAGRGLAPIRIRVGIHTGRVVVGNIGPAKRVNYTIVGDAVNTAQRIEQLGRELGSGDGPATILVSGMTAAQLGDEFVCRPAGRFTVRGRDEVVPVYRLEAAADLQPASVSGAVGA